MHRTFPVRLVMWVGFAAVIGACSIFTLLQKHTGFGTFRNVATAQESSCRESDTRGTQVYFVGCGGFF